MNSDMKGPHIFGIRHLSPGGAYHLRAFLEEVKPTAVLVEGPSDANGLIRHLTGKGVLLPSAILSYTEEIPVRTLLYPFAEYSPEYQALLWARENGALAEFIDLPSGVFIPLEYIREEDNENDKEPAENIYETWAHLAGERDYESYWERYFEHNLSRDGYRLSILEFSKCIRSLSEGSERACQKHEYAKNLVREAFMRRRIKETIDGGHNPNRIVVVTGAYHASALSMEFAPMADDEFNKLPKANTRTTLMPYSYYKLSSRSGYGAGNNAPAYFQMMWECLCKNDMERLSSYYLSSIASDLREHGTYRSPAEVIEGVRLAGALSALSCGSIPVLKDLRDAAVTNLGHGSFSTVAEAVARVEIGTAIGSLPEGISQTPLQDDFYRELKRLKLEKYRSAVAQDLELDLRENRRVKSEEAAFLDLNRSFFLQRLRILGVSFAKYIPLDKKLSTWAEKWVLQWSPQSEIELVESTLKGESIELAVAFRFKERLDTVKSAAEAAEIIREAQECGMLSSMEQARDALQRLSTDSGSFMEIAGAVRELASVISYGDVRKTDSSHFIPLLSQLFLRGCLLLMDACSCSDEAAVPVLEAIGDMNFASVEHFNEVDEELWIKKLSELSDRDDKNARLSGCACAILLERNLIDGEKLSAEVSRRLSPGIDASLGSGWFEGLSMRNRYALLSRMNLWEQLESYVDSLDDEQFKRALVFLRRAFSRFEPSEKVRIAEMLGDIWGIGKDAASDYLSRELDEEEKGRIESLNEFDFGDI